MGCTPEICDCYPGVHKAGPGDALRRGTNFSAERSIQRGTRRGCTLLPTAGNVCWWVEWTCSFIISFGSHSNFHEEGIIISILEIIKLRCSEVYKLHIITEFVNGGGSNPRISDSKHSCFWPLCYPIVLLYSSVGYISTNELLTLSRTLNGGLKERWNECLVLHYHSWFLNSLYLSLYSDYSGCGPHVTHTSLIVAKQDPSRGAFPWQNPPLGPQPASCLQKNFSLLLG